MAAENTTRVEPLYFYYDAGRAEWTFPLHVDAVTNSSNDGEHVVTERDRFVFGMASRGTSFELVNAP